MSNDKAAATYHPDDPPPEAPPIEPAEDDLPPLSVVDEILKEASDLLVGVEHLLVAHRRKCGDDHFQLGRLQDAQERVGQAVNAAMSARRGLREQRR